MNKIHIFSTARSGTHYLESLISGMLDIPIIPTPFEEWDDEDVPSSQELITNVNEFSAIDSMVYKTHPNWLYPIGTDMLQPIRQFAQVADYTIGLLRLNIVEASLSFALAYHNWLDEQSHTGSFRPPYKNVTVSMSMEHFTECCVQILAMYELMVTQTEIRCDKIIYYEDLVFNSTDSSLTGLTPIHNIESSVEKAKSKQITIANYDELYAYAISFYSTTQSSMTIVNGVITNIDLTNLKKGK